jgi:hypothetical protein
MKLVICPINCKDQFVRYIIYSNSKEALFKNHNLYLQTKTDVVGDLIHLIGFKMNFLVKLLANRVVLYYINGMVITPQCTATFFRSVVLPEFRY